MLIKENKTEELEDSEELDDFEEEVASNDAEASSVGKVLGADEMEVEEVEEIINAVSLKAKFKVFDEKIKKATNAPKFLYNVFRQDVKAELPLNT